MVCVMSVLSFSDVLRQWAGCPFVGTCFVGELEGPCDEFTFEFGSFWDFGFEVMAGPTVTTSSSFPAI